MGLSRINGFETPAGVRERLVLILGQFHHTGVVGNRVEGVERLYDSVTYQVYYSDAADVTPPTVGRVSVGWGGPGSPLRFVAQVADASTVTCAIAVYTDGRGAWQSLALGYDALHDEWAGQVPTTGMAAGGAAAEEIAFMIQAVDGAGNVGISRARGAYFSPLVVDAGPDQTTVEGREVTVTGYGPAGAAVSWDFGDGMTVEGSYTATHRFAENGSFEVTLWAEDSEGRVGMDRLTVTVANAAPVVSVQGFAPAAGVAVVPLAAVTVTVTFTDPGSLDIHTAVVRWGDGGQGEGAVQEQAGAGVVIASHVYTGTGLFTVTACVSDDEGAEGCGSADVAVGLPVTPTGTRIATPTATPTGTPTPTGTRVATPTATPTTVITVRSRQYLPLLLKRGR